MSISLIWREIWALREKTYCFEAVLSDSRRSMVWVKLAFRSLISDSKVVFSFSRSSLRTCSQVWTFISISVTSFSFSSFHTLSHRSISSLKLFISFSFSSIAASTSFSAFSSYLFTSIFSVFIFSNISSEIQATSSYLSLSF